MKQRGRKSGAALAVAPTTELEQARQRPPAPEGLTDGEKSVWRRIVAAMPGDWFRPEHRDVLTAYCQHTVRADMLNRMANEIKPGDIGTGDSENRIHLDDFDRVCRMADRETRAALALARSMRLTHQAQIRAETAAMKRDGEIGESKPWDA